MDIFRKLSIQLILTLAFSFIFFSNAHAQTVTVNPSIPKENTGGVNIKIEGLNPNATYEVCSQNTSANCRAGDAFDFWDLKADSSGTLSFQVCAQSQNQIKVGCNENTDYWHTSTYSMKISGRTGAIGFKSAVEFTVEHFYPTLVVTTYPQPTTGKPKPSDEIVVIMSGSRRLFNDESRNDYELILKKSGALVNNKETRILNNGTETINFGKLSEGSYLMEIKDKGGSFVYYLVEIEVENDTDGGSINVIIDPTDKDKSVGTGKSGRFPGQNPCNNGKECKTALGTIPTNPTGFATKVLGIALGIAGGIALIILVIGSIRVITSSGDQQKLQNGREMIIAAIAGLLFIIFSVLILRAIGTGIVGINF